MVFPDNRLTQQRLLHGTPYQQTECFVRGPVEKGGDRQVRSGSRQLRRWGVLVKACDERLQLSRTLAACLSDERQQSKVSHSLEELFRQRLFGIACGYTDGNDAARLAEDPVMKLLAGRDPIAGGSLASQPTLSRFENAVRPRDLLRLSEALADAVIARHKRRKKLGAWIESAITASQRAMPSPLRRWR